MLKDSVRTLTYRDSIINVSHVTSAKPRLDCKVMSRTLCRLSVFSHHLTSSSLERSSHQGQDSPGCRLWNWHPEYVCCSSRREARLCRKHLNTILPLDALLTRLTTQIDCSNIAKQARQIVKDNKLDHVVTVIQAKVCAATHDRNTWS